MSATTTTSFAKSESHKPAKIPAFVYSDSETCNANGYFWRKNGTCSETLEIQERNLTVISLLDKPTCQEEGFYWYKQSTHKDAASTCHGCPIGKVAHGTTCACPAGFIQNKITRQCSCPNGVKPYYDRSGAHCTMNNDREIARTKTEDTQAACKNLNFAHKTCEAPDAPSTCENTKTQETAVVPAE